MILVYFNDWGMPHVPEAFHVIEFFSGAGNVGKSCRWAGHPTAQLDVAMGVRMKAKKQNAFDMSTPAGLSQLASINLRSLILIMLHLSVFSPYKLEACCLGALACAAVQLLQAVRCGMHKLQQHEQGHFKAERGDALG